MGELSPQGPVLLLKLWATSGGRCRVATSGDDIELSCSMHPSAKKGATARLVHTRASVWAVAVTGTGGGLWSRALVAWTGPCSLDTAATVTNNINKV